MRPGKLRRYYVKTYEELYLAVDRRMRAISILRTRKNKQLSALRTTLLAKLSTAYNILKSEIDKLDSLIKDLSKSHSFYREIFTLETGKYPEDLSPVIKKMKRSISIIYREHRIRIKQSREKREAVIAFRSGIGRLLSVYRRRRRVIESIKYAVAELSKLPDIVDGYTVIIAGMPQVGKSTLLSKLTRAKPKISPFPFTTKTVIVGHILVEPYGRITLVDTPGILDRPIDKKNPIELKAVLAVKHLADTVLYMFDPSPQSYYSFDEQIRVYRSIVELIENKEVVPVFNKIDLTPRELLESRASLLERIYGSKPLQVSALRGDNLDRLRDLLIDKFMEKTRHLLRRF